MSRTLEHTPLPWVVATWEGFLEIRADDRDRTLVCDVAGSSADAELIAKACNNHHELVAIVRELVSAWGDCSHESRFGKAIAAARDILRRVE